MKYKTGGRNIFHLLLKIETDGYYYKFANYNKYFR